MRDGINNNVISVGYDNVVVNSKLWKIAGLLEWRRKEEKYSEDQTVAVAAQTVKVVKMQLLFFYSLILQ